MNIRTVLHECGLSISIYSPEVVSCRMCSCAPGGYMSLFQPPRCFTAVPTPSNPKPNTELSNFFQIFESQQVVDCRPPPLSPRAHQFVQRGLSFFLQIPKILYNHDYGVFFNFLFYETY